MNAGQRTLALSLDCGKAPSLGVTIKRPDPDHDRHAAIFYLHGGGLIFGVRDDLPEPYQKAILEQGYALVATSYPLAPQAKIQDILEAVHKVYLALDDVLPEGRTILCGRSAGAYLALMLANQLRKDGATCPAVIDFYGYCDLAGEMQSALFQPSLFYRRNYTILSPRTTRKMAGTELLVEAPIEERFDLYVFARQTGNWGSLLGITPSNAKTFSLDLAAQKSLPPLFIAASRDDRDVPFQNAVNLAGHAASATTFFIDAGGHDFDRTLVSTKGMEAWAACLSWAEHLLP